MSWIDREENTQFSIQTGDGKIYKPFWKSGEKSKEFNNQIFDFIDVEGSFVDRKKTKSNKYNLVFWFQGDDHLSESDEFEKSSNDNRSWKVTHPIYGILTGQPTSLSRGNSNLNVTEISVEFWESINNQYPRKKESVLDMINSKNSEYSFNSSNIYASKVNLKLFDKNTVEQNVKNISLRYENLLNDTNFSEFQLIKGKTFQSIDNIITDPSAAIRDINTLILFPSNFKKSVNDRFFLFKNIYNDVKEVLQIKNNRNNKAYFESSGGAVITSLANTLINPIENDYISRSHIEELNYSFLEIYEDYLKTLDNSQVDLQNVDNSFSIGFKGQINLNSIVSDTIYNLFEIAFNSKQERIVQVDKDTNLISLTHKYVGLDSNDYNLQKFREINNIKNKKLLIVKKGSKIKYFV